MFEQRKHIVKKRKFFKLSNFVKINKKKLAIFIQKIVKRKMVTKLTNYQNTLKIINKMTQEKLEFILNF